MATAPVRGAGLQAENVAVTYPLPDGGTLGVLDIARLDLSAGSFTAVCGPSGSGKTTLLNVLSGIERPRRGRIAWDGVDIFGLGESARDRWRRGAIGLIFQQFHLFPGLSPLENVLLPARFGRFSVAAEVGQRARQLLETVGVRAAGDVARLSRGEQQRVAIARALLFQPPIILADEPTASLDAASADLVTDLLFEACRGTGATLLLVTHDRALAQRCGRVLDLHAGCFVTGPALASAS